MHIWSKSLIEHDSSIAFFLLKFKEKGLMTDSTQSFTVTSKTKIELLVLWKEVNLNIIIFLKRFLYFRILMQSSWAKIDIAVKIM